jgi:lysophospholipase L1-like esterase
MIGRRLGPTARAATKATLVLLVSLLAGEAALRVYHRLSPSFVFLDDSYNRFRGRPLSANWDSRLNSRGFNDREFRDTKQGYRILGLGDSFAFGVVPYAANYLTLLEARLQGEHPGLEVLNMGIPGTGPRDYLALLVKEGLPLRPDMVLVSFFVGNDFTESDRTPERRRLSSHSYVASLARYLFAVRPKYAGEQYHLQGAYCDDCPGFAPRVHLEIEAARSLIYVAGQPRFPKLLDDAVHYLAEMRDICRRESIDYVVLIIPDEVQVDPELQREVRSTFFSHVRDGSWQPTLPNERLAERLQRLAIEHIDLYPDFARQGAARRLYRPRDTHWNVAGNELAARILAEWLAPRLARRAPPAG